MTKIELAIRNIDWQIEATEKEIAELQGQIKENINLGHMEYYADGILAYAQRMAEASKKLVGLREQRKMLEYIAADDED